MTSPGPSADAPTAGWGRRFLALLVDWFACTLVVIAFIGTAAWSDNPYSGFYVLGVYVAEGGLLTALAGGSFGKLVTGLRTVRNDGSYGPVGLIQALIRSALVALVIPPLVYKPDGRGLHDLAASSRTMRVADLRALGS